MNANERCRMIADLFNEMAKSEECPDLRGVPDGELRRLHEAAVSRSRPPEMEPAERERMVNEVARRTDYSRADAERWPDATLRTAHEAVEKHGHGRAGVAVVGGGGGGDRRGGLSFDVRSTLGAGPGVDPREWKNSEGESSKSGSGLSFECPPTI